MERTVKSSEGRGPSRGGRTRLQQKLCVGSPEFHCPGHCNSMSCLKSRRRRCCPRILLLLQSTTCHEPHCTHQIADFLLGVKCIPWDACPRFAVIFSMRRWLLSVFLSIIFRSIILATVDSAHITKMKTPALRPKTNLAIHSFRERHGRAMYKISSTSGVASAQQTPAKANFPLKRACPLQDDTTE